MPCDIVQAENLEYAAFHRRNPLRERELVNMTIEHANSKSQGITLSCVYRNWYGSDCILRSHGADCPVQWFNNTVL